MKKFAVEFLRRGLMAAWGGPVVVALVYLILDANGAADALSVTQLSMGILSATLMAFIAGGVTAIYQTERLPLPFSILIHFGVLYLDYILIYLMNGWLQNALTPILVFTAVFAAGFTLIWALIWFFSVRDVKKVNASMRR